MSRKIMFLIVAALLVACQPPASPDPQQERLEQACADWCDAAVPCSNFYAMKWSFDDLESCESSCISYAQSVRDELGESCFEIVLDDRECASELTCEEFTAYEEYASDEPPSILPPPCQEEVAAQLDGCYL